MIRLGLQMWTIHYDCPEFPSKFVVRLWITGTALVQDPEPLAVCDTLAAARMVLPPNLYQMSPAGDVDNSTIIEIWV